MKELWNHLAEDGIQLFNNWAFLGLFSLLVLDLILKLMVPSQTISFSQILYDSLKQIAAYAAESALELLGAVKSLLGFTGALRYIFFGRFNNGVKYVISNYTIIFAVMVSIWMVQGGLEEFTGRNMGMILSIALLGSFLLSVLWLVQLFVPEVDVEKPVVCYFELENNGEKFLKKASAGQNPQAPVEDVKNRIWYTRIVAILTVAVLFAVISIFSYVHLFRSRLERVIVYHSLYSVIELADKNEELCSEELRDYSWKAERILRRYLEKIEVEYFYAAADESPEEVQSEREIYKNKFDQVRAWMDGSPSQEFMDPEELELAFADVTDWAYQEEWGQYGGALRENINGATIFLNEEAKDQKQKEAVDNYILQLGYFRDDIKKLFHNYIELERYFWEKNGGERGFHCREAKSVLSELQMRSTMEDKEREERGASGERKAVMEGLDRIIESFQEIPDTEDIYFGKMGIDGNTEGTVYLKGYHTGQYVKPFHLMYRMLNPNLYSIERAMIALHSSNVWNSWFVLGIIICVSCLHALIIVVCMIRGTLANVASVGNKRNLIRCLFIKENGQAVPSGKKRIEPLVVLGLTAVFTVFGSCLGTCREKAGFFLTAAVSMLAACLSTKLGSTVLYARIQGAKRISSDTEETVTGDDNVQEVSAAEPELDSADTTFANNLTESARQLLENSSIRMLGKVTKRKCRWEEANERAEYRKRQVKQWRNNYHYKVKAFIPSKFPYLEETGRILEECMFIPDKSVNKLHRSVMGFLCESALAYPVYKDETGYELTGYVLSREWKLLLIDCLILKSIDSYGVPHTYEEDLKDYEEDLER